MAVHLVRRKRTITIIFVLCFVSVFVLYNRGKQEAANFDTVREIQRDDASRSGVFVTSSEENMPTVPFLPSRIYSVVAVDVVERHEKERGLGQELGDGADGVEGDKNPKERASSKMKNENGDEKDDENVNENKSEAERNMYDGKEHTSKIEAERFSKTEVNTVGEHRNKLEKKANGTDELENRNNGKSEGISKKSRGAKIVRLQSKRQGKENTKNAHSNWTKKEKGQKENEDGNEGKENKIMKKTRGHLGGKMNSTLTDQQIPEDDEYERNSILKNNTLPTLLPSSHWILGKIKKFLTSNKEINSPKILNNSVPSTNQTNNTSAPTSMANFRNETAKFNNRRLKTTRPSTTQRPRTTGVVYRNHENTAGFSHDEPLACKVPKLDPFYPLMLPLIRDVGTDLRTRCRTIYPRTPSFSVFNNKLVLRPGINQTTISRKSITLREIQREGDSSFMYTEEKKPFRGLKNIRKSKDIGKSDFFRVHYEMDGQRVSDLYARVARRVDILDEQLKKMRTFKKKGLPLNVIIIGFDSTSRGNFVRKMGRVVSFLETRLHTYFMEGMSIVGDATTPVLTALLTGKRETELPEGRTSFDGNPIDDWPWIMKEYEKQGYMTLYAEDDPSVSSFNLRLEGFEQSPAHHYMRPFWLSLENERERDEPGLCSKSESIANLTLKYIQNFYDTYPKARKFAFGFLSYLTHAHPNHLSYAENDLLWFLRTFVNKGYHKDTMVIIMGDHGSRNAEYRDTMQGKLEERLPWFSVSLPSSFHRSFGDLATNLRSNQAIIMSPFDVHATLRHVLTYPEIPENELTQSLFNKLPSNRTCDDAGIDEHWCPCLEWSTVNVTSEQVRGIASAAVDHINTELSKISLLQTSCHHLTLDNVQDAVTLQANIKVQEFDSTDQDGDRSVRFGMGTREESRYQIIFTTKPNNGKYEATAVLATDRVIVNPEISRINRYDDQPKCIAKRYPYARKFCFCRNSA